MWIPVVLVWLPNSNKWNLAGGVISCCSNNLFVCHVCELKCYIQLFLVLLLCI